MKNYEKCNLRKKGTDCSFVMNIMLFVCIIVLCCATGSSTADTDISIKQEEERLKQIEQRKKSIEQELEGLKQEETNYQKSLEKIQTLLNEAEKELQIAKKNYQKTLQQIEKLEEELKIEENKMELQLIILKNRLKKFYKYNNITYLSVLLESKDFSQFLNRCRYLECILTDDAEIVNQVSEQVAFVKKQRDSLENKKEISKLLEQEIEKEKENIEISIEAKNKYIDKIEQEKKNKLAKLEELEKSSAQIKEIIEIAYREKEKAKQAQQQASQQQSGETKERKEQTLQPRKGIFQLPIKGSIISNYGQQKEEDLNAYVFNSGIDISAPLGEPVRAASFGTVIYIGNVKGYGDIVILDHGGNVVTLYAHLSEILVKANTQVTKGQIIAQIGTSGGAPSPRLHFEVRVEGKPVNPFDWL
jgi:septal ring factor EnvC (AmiA/AmiB activator)